jgi:hypothetical protein
MKKLLLLFTLLIFGCNSSILDDPSTTIKYSIPEPAHVKLSVENSYNTLIAILVNTNLPAGSFNANFDSSNLAEGIYFYILEIKPENGIETKTIKKMLLIK